MELPLPEADELGRPAWSVTSADISKAYRRLSVLVHPDKNPGEDARKAFEALNETYRKLRDPSQLVSVQHFLAEPPHLMASSSCYQATYALLMTQLYALFASAQLKLHLLHEGQTSTVPMPGFPILCRRTY